VRRYFPRIEAERAVDGASHDQYLIDRYPFGTRPATLHEPGMPFA
jgi:hypothetical protein